MAGSRATAMSMPEMEMMVQILDQRDYDGKKKKYPNQNLRKNSILDTIVRSIRKEFGIPRSREQLRKRWSDMKCREQDLLDDIRQRIGENSRNIRASRGARRDGRKNAAFSPLMEGSQELEQGPQDFMGVTQGPPVSLGSTQGPQVSLGSTQGPQVSLHVTQRPESSLGGAQRPQTSLGGAQRPQTSLGAQRPQTSLGGAQGPQTSLFLAQKNQKKNVNPLCAVCRLRVTKYGRDKCASCGDRGTKRANMAVSPSMQNGAELDQEPPCSLDVTQEPPGSPGVVQGPQTCSYDESLINQTLRIQINFMSQLKALVTEAEAKLIALQNE